MPYRRSSSPSCCFIHQLRRFEAFYAVAQRYKITRPIISTSIHIISFLIIETGDIWLDGVCSISCLETFSSARKLAHIPVWTALFRASRVLLGFLSPPSCYSYRPRSQEIPADRLYTWWRLNVGCCPSWIVWCARRKQTSWWASSNPTVALAAVLLWWCFKRTSIVVTTVSIIAHEASQCRLHQRIALCK